MIRANARKKTMALLDEVFELGCTTFDTAHDYGKGACERTVGRWINARGVREKVVIIGKGAHHNVDRSRVTPFDITADLYDSLARFKIDYIDLYLPHRDDPSVPVGPIIETLNEHLGAGRIRAIGASNWTHQRIQEANQFAQAHGLIPFVASSPNLSLAEQVREPWRNVLSIGGHKGQAARDWYAREQMPLFTWSSLAGGFFSGRFTRDNLDSFHSAVDKLCVRAYGCEDNFQRLDRARTLAAEKGSTIPQIALAYILNQPLNVFAVVGHQTADEFKTNLEACEIQLSPAELAWLDLRSESHEASIDPLQSSPTVAMKDKAAQAMG